MNSTASTEIRALYDRAVAVMRNAHAPYSRFSVGCALLTDKHKIHTGCNVENASFGATLCAERSAVAAAVAAGDLIAGESSIIQVLVVTDTKEPVAPCGICRQVLFEFGREIRIHSGTVSGGPDNLRTYTIDELLPAPPNDSIEWT